MADGFVGEQSRKKYIKVNDQGRRIGEDNPRATVSDHDLSLLMVFLDERDELIERCESNGCTKAEIDIELVTMGLSYRLLALKFEVHKSMIAKVHNGHRRCQTVARLKPCRKEQK